MNDSSRCDEPRQTDDPCQSSERGQATAEYALLTGVVALVIALVAAWAAGTGKVGRLLDVVFDGLIRAAG
ncbi:MAG: hypothetical protein GXP35_02625 [Actinobacteria bacterium]|nr:hypothetical protein [Actinomycetota bacterium]